MAWTVNRQGSFYELTPDGSTNFLWSTYFPNEPEGHLVEEIQVYFSAANDVVNIQTHSTTGPSIFKYTSIDGVSVAKRFFGGLVKMVIVNASQTFSAAANVRIIVQIR